MTTRRRLCASSALCAVVLALTACGSDDDAAGTNTTETTTTDTTTETTTTTTPKPPPPAQPVEIRVRVVGGVPKGGIVRESAEKGDRVAVVVTSDVSDHVHVHGYDLFRDVGPGMPARIRFRAKLPGRFEIELEDRHTPIAELTVTP